MLLFSVSYLQTEGKTRTCLITMLDESRNNTKYYVLPYKAVTVCAETFFSSE